MVQAGHEIAARLPTHEDWAARATALRTQIVLVGADPMDGHLLKTLCLVSHTQAVILFTADSNSATIRAATRAGASAYVVGELNRDRILSVINAALARFEQKQVLEREVKTTAIQLKNRKVVERAKGILMHQRGLNEESAYRALRSMAMDRNLQIADVAQTIVSVAGLLTSTH